MVTSKEVLVYDKDNNFVGEYKSVSESCRNLNLQQSNATKVLKGRRIHTKGYTFKYKEI